MKSLKYFALIVTITALTACRADITPEKADALEVQYEAAVMARNDAYVELDKCIFRKILEIDDGTKDGVTVSNLVVSGCHGKYFDFIQSWREEQGVLVKARHGRNIGYPEERADRRGFYYTLRMSLVYNRRTKVARSRSKIFLNRMAAYRMRMLDDKTFRRISDAALEKDIRSRIKSDLTELRSLLMERNAPKRNAPDPVVDDDDDESPD
ncbi:MAG: hypothetical protein LBG78_03570 [Azoarcus sp.]|jgi:hypothetical protein|nr:hypothetical protein [Azoarcus sp.]